MRRGRTRRAKAPLVPQLVRTEIGLEQTNRVVLRNHGTGGKGGIAAIVEMATTPVAPRMRNHLVETSEAFARDMAVVRGVIVAEAPVVITSVQGPIAKETARRRLGRLKRAERAHRGRKVAAKAVSGPPVEMVSVETPNTVHPPPRQVIEARLVAAVLAVGVDARARCPKAVKIIPAINLRARPRKNTARTRKNLRGRRSRRIAAPRQKRARQRRAACSAPLSTYHTAQRGAITAISCHTHFLMGIFWMIHFS